MTEFGYLTVPGVLVIYAEITKASRVQQADVQDIGALESALAQPQQTFDGNDLYPTIEAKAGTLLYSICQGHPFIDGNKRTAFMAARVFLRMNGYDLVVDTYEAREFMYSVARGEISSDKVAQWIRRWLQPFDSPLI